jgi:hypothetical protein
MDQLTESRLSNIRLATRCGACTRSGAPCRCPAIRGRARCRIHGGLSPGAPRGSANGNYRDGSYTLEAEEERRWLRELRSLCAKLGGDE